MEERARSEASTSAGATTADVDADKSEETQYSSSVSPPPEPVKRTQSEPEPTKCCWVCFASEDDDQQALWLHPCRCKGSMKYVHESCLQRWIDEKQKGNIFSRVLCNQCNAAYLMVYPSVNRSLWLLARLDAYANAVSPWMAGGFILGGIYWVSVTYGAISMMQMLGYSRAMSMMERNEPILLLIGLPAIPVVLLTANLIRWDDRVAYYLYKRSRIAADAKKKGMPLSPMQPTRLNDGHSGSRFLCTALALPTISMIAGRIFYSTYSHWSTWRRNLMGSITYLTIKGICSVYFRYSRLVQKHKRQILNYPSENAVGTQTIDSEFEELRQALRRENI